MVIIVFGLPGSGKSFFAEHFSAAIDAAYISSDRIRKELFKARNYSEEEKSAVYDEMIGRMKQAHADKKHVVLDGTFYKATIRQKFEIEAQASNAIIKYIEVTASETTIQERVGIKREHSEADYAVYLKLK